MGCGCSTSEGNSVKYIGDDKQWKAEFEKNENKL